MNKVYHCGYSALGTREWVDELMLQPNMLLIDTRLKAYSWRCDWREDALKAKYGKRYRQAGRLLGNLNYQGGPIKIVDLDGGVKGLMMYLNEGRDLILLCQCVHDGCHRHEILKALCEVMPDVEVVQPPTCHVESGIVKAISVREPYATWLANPGKFINAQITPKRIENREWNTEYRGRILIHASKTFEKTAIPFWLSQCPNLGDAVSLDPEDYPLDGRLVGEATLEKVVTQVDPEAKDPWFCGKYGFLLAHAKPIDPPIKYRGQLKLFDVSESILLDNQQDKSSV